MDEKTKPRGAEMCGRTLLVTSSPLLFQAEIQDQETEL